MTATDGKGLVAFKHDAFRGARHRKKRSRPAPLRQGDLDQLCGVYAIINACRAICPELDRDQTRELPFMLFAETLHRIERSEDLDFSDALTGGLDFRQLLKVARVMASIIRELIGVELTIERIQLAPGLLESLDPLWAELKRRLTPTCAVILGLEGEEGHWTPAVDITRQRLELLDSRNTNVLLRADCGIRIGAAEHIINPTCLLAISRKRPGRARPRRGRQ